MRLLSLVLSLVVGFLLITTGFAAERVVVCEIIGEED